jgi:hypothetical protein
VAGLTRQVTAAVLAAYDFYRFGCVADVGGGSGAFLVGLLSAYPNLSAVLFAPSSQFAGHGGIDVGDDVRLVAPEARS